MIQSGGSIVSEHVRQRAGREGRAAAATLTVTTEGRVTAGTTGAGRGGNLMLSAPQVTISNGGTISASATGSGNAGTVSVTAPARLDVSGGSITASYGAIGRRKRRPHSAGDMLFADGGTISAAAQGVTANDSGGNVTIDPQFAACCAAAKFSLVQTPAMAATSVSCRNLRHRHDEQDQRIATVGLNGEVAIDSPNEITGKIIPLVPPAVDVTPGWYRNAALKPWLAAQLLDGGTGSFTGLPH